MYHLEFFYGRREIPPKKAQGADEPPSIPNQSEDFIDFLRRIHKMIHAAGPQGIEYREIVKRLELDKALATKFEEYLLSHYTRKLACLGMIVIGSKAISKKVNIRFAIDTCYSEQYRRQEADSETLGSES